jgi:hypothetical protein
VSRMLLVAAVALGLLGAVTFSLAPAASTGLPAPLETYLASTVRLTAAERSQLIGGAPVTRLLQADESKEVAVFGAAWINASVSSYLDLVKNVETFERGDSFKITKRISFPPRIEDFSELRLPDEDVADLRTCRVGDCNVKLGERSMERFRTEIDWNSPNHRSAVDALMRRLLLEYVTGYLEGGNERLAVYRDSGRPTFVAGELREMIDEMPELTTYMPAVRRYLLEYPKVTPQDSTSSSFLYWQETEFGLKPTIRVSHLAIREGADGATVVASKMLYATHYFWTGLELRVLLPEPSRGRGFWLVIVNRGRSDGLSGFTGVFARRRVSSEALTGVSAVLRMTRQKLERQ